MKTAIAKGIDVSRWQGNIDWRKVKAAGIQFAMIRLGSGVPSGTAYTLDTMFHKNMEQALEAGLGVGVYFYSYATSVAAAKREGEFVRGTLKAYKGKLTYPVAFDLEDPTQQSLGKIVLSGMIAAFSEVLEQAGYYVSLYANAYWLKTKLDAATVSRYDVWLAEWSAAPTYTGSYGMWQYGVLGCTGTKGKDYTLDGRIDGISANIDVNYAYKDYPAIIRENGLNGFAKQEPLAPAPTEPEGTDWSAKGLEMLAGAGVIEDPDAWAGRMEDTVTVGELLALLGKLHK